ncbi:MAG: DUF255 domain-containing protein [Candidatus Marinimicrobia bacterium]|nr:DUF255 domain-containing protein [Candidatus Neomarinimicrobiota bacterium]
MKKSLLSALFSLIFLFQITAEAGQSWYAFQDGMKLADGGEKHLIIDFYADWCHWCKVMDKETFSDPEVEKQLFKNFIPIKLNAESSSETITFKGQQLTPRQLTSVFQVTGFPSLAFLTPDMEVITVIPGYIKKDMFMNILEYMERECYKSQTSFDEFLEKGCDNRKSK